ncbi:MAG: tRNA (guanosine(37)-N1)-methyltransferase TrmD [candidate division WOR-3 bacterium]|nr:tRNA (guanosine(37)-N1)-methyltransferase TrmD [candidate division WOR-3 bacterium]MDH5683359.1 tRNA (guanosine(37)-N1)-methyltransferase TrmD [candidate division WOR-3 bacterium]
MLFQIITIFPEFFSGPLACGVLRIAHEKKIAGIETINLRDFTHDNYRTVDDAPFGGGAGMILKPEPIFEAVEKIKQDGSHSILLSPQGRRFDQKVAAGLSQKTHIIIICGRYKGVDERVRKFLVDDEISIGDYILSGGEAAALVIIEAVVRLLPGVVGDEESITTDSFSQNLLDAPYYTRPREFRGLKVPEVLVSGNHEAIRQWRRFQALKATKERRPELLRTIELTEAEKKFLERKEPENGGEDEKS